MKKHLLFVAGILLLSHSYGQGLYVKVGGGYALPMGSQSLIEPTTATEIVGNASIVTSTTTVVKGSYGAGIVINGAVGYKFSPFIGLDLNLCYQIGKEFEGTTKLTDGFGATFMIKETQKSQGIFAAPTLMFMAGTEGVRPYGVVGVILGSVKLEENTTSLFDDGDVPVNSSFKRETKGDLAFGFRGGIGVDINISDRFSVFAEGIFNAISYYPKKSEIVEALVDGNDVLDDSAVSDRETVYVDELTVVTVNNVENVDRNQPSQELRSPRPLSSVGLNAGLKIKLGSD
jgi:opacity protein-like surface antigen